MIKIAEITPAQAARFGEWSEKWIAVGLSTAPADFGRAERAALRAYALCGLGCPKLVLWMSSPYGACFGGYLGCLFLSQVRSQVWRQVGSQVWRQVGSQVWRQVGSQVRSQVESQVWSQVESQVGSQVGSQVRSQVESQVGSQVESQVESQVWSQVWSQVESQVGSQVWSQVWSQVRSQVGSQVESQVWSQVRSQVWSQVRSQVESQVWSQVRSQVESQVGSQVWSQVGSQVYSNSYHGSFWAPWVAYVSFIRDVLGWDNSILEQFRIEEDLVESCNWLWWHEDVLAISDRPEVLRRDDQGRLHCEDGPAICYRDGWGVWSWHGVTVPRAWVEDRVSLSPVVALKQENVERRRAACEIVGWDRILVELNARTIDCDPDPEIGELLRVDLPDAPGEQFLRVRCGTGRTFVIPVPPYVPTALAANAWTYDLDPNIMKLKENRT